MGQCAPTTQSFPVQPRNSDAAPGRWLGRAGRTLPALASQASLPGAPARSATGRPSPRWPVLQAKCRRSCFGRSGNPAGWIRHIRSPGRKRWRGQETDGRGSARAADGWHTRAYVRSAPSGPEGPRATGPRAPWHRGSADAGTRVSFHTATGKCSPCLLGSNRLGFQLAVRGGRPTRPRDWSCPPALLRVARRHNFTDEDAPDSSTVPSAFATSRYGCAGPDPAYCISYGILQNRKETTETGRMVPGAGLEPARPIAANGF